MGDLTDAAFLQRCKDAMSKPAPMDALRLIASGRATILVRGSEILLDALDGSAVREIDDEITTTGRMLGLAGAWPLVGAGMVDRFGCVTEDGRKMLDQPAHKGEER